MKGIIFSEPMAKAWLEGRKTVTRRLIKKQPVSGFDETFLHTSLVGSFYRPGETVYVKETWRETWSGGSPDHGYEVGIEYRAKLDVSHGYMGKTAKVPEMHYGYKLTKKGKAAWRSPLFMPEWASRSKALIVSVRPERVQEITEEEAIKEGVLSSDYEKTYRYAFSRLWDSIHPGSWERNDWIWRIELRGEQ